MKITKKLAINYAKKLLPHFHLEKYPTVFKTSDKLGFDYELLFDLNERKSDYTREFDSCTIRFLFSDNECIFQNLDNGLELDVTADVKDYLDNFNIEDLISV